MNLIAWKKSVGLFSQLCVFLILSGFSAYCQASQTEPCINQSPRKVNFDQTRQTPSQPGTDFDFVSATPLVGSGPQDPVDTLTYQRMTLTLCDRHYHLPVENVQGCTNETRDLHGLVPGQWIEVHTVYAAAVSTEGECSQGHDHGLRCCTKPPFVVRGYSAQIGTTDHLFNGDHTEWLGSATSEVPSGCNPTPAQWNFTLGCLGVLTKEYVAHVVGGEPHHARQLQSPNNLSVDLAFVPLSGDIHSNDTKQKTCRSIRTAWIPDTAAANRICPGVCKVPLGRPDMVGGNVNWAQHGSATDGYATCVCCPDVRPQ